VEYRKKRQTLDPYREGAQAALDGVEFWENPYNSERGVRDFCLGWFFGWCEGKSNAPKPKKRATKSTSKSEAAEQ
jgi:hypothetical protein